MPSSNISNPSDRLLERADEFARQEPAKAVATAFGFGFFLHLLPVGAIAHLLVSLLFALSRPILLVLGVVKVFDWVGVPSRPTS